MTYHLPYNNLQPLSPQTDVEIHAIALFVIRNFIFHFTDGKENKNSETSTNAPPAMTGPCALEFLKKAKEMEEGFKGNN